MQDAFCSQAALPALLTDTSRSPRRALQSGAAGSGISSLSVSLLHT